MSTILSEYHNEITRKTGAAGDDSSSPDGPGFQYDCATETAIDLLVSAGYDSEGSDTLGGAIGEDVQTLLTLAFHLLPGLESFVQRTLAER